MDNAKLISRVTAICSEHLGIEESKIAMTSNFVDDLGADSLDMLELTMGFEDDFGVTIDDDETVDPRTGVSRIVTVQDAVDLVAKKLGQ